MLVTNSDPKILYVHIPKTGGSSFEKWLEKRFISRWQHKNIDHLYFDEIQVLTKRRFDIQDHYKFTICRNPYDRFYSMCLHICRTLNEKNVNIEKILNLIKSNEFESTHKFDTMTNYIKGGHFEAFKYEEYPQVVRHFKDKFGIIDEPEIENRNNSVNPDEPVYPLKELKYLKIYENNRKFGTIVNELYADDFKNFDYKMIAW